MASLIYGFSFGQPSSSLHAFMLILSRYFEQGCHIHFVVIKRTCLRTDTRIVFSTGESVLRISLFGKGLRELEVDFEAFLASSSSVLIDMELQELEKLVSGAILGSGEVGNGGYADEGNYASPKN